MILPSSPFAHFTYSTSLAVSIGILGLTIGIGIIIYAIVRREVNKNEVETL
jgi:hypothetical protein